MFWTNKRFPANRVFGVQAIRRKRFLRGIREPNREAFPIEFTDTRQGFPNGGPGTVRGVSPNRKVRVPVHKAVPKPDVFC